MENGEEGSIYKTDQGFYFILTDDQYCEYFDEENQIFNIPELGCVQYSNK